MISTHTLTWSVTDENDCTTMIWGNFNSHAHVERDLSNKIRNGVEKISTHTLTWSVT